MLPGSLIDELPPEVARRLLAESRRRKFRRNEVVFHEGDPGEALHLIDKGHIAIRGTTPLGDIVTFAVLGPGETFGEQALLVEDSRRTASAVAVEAAETRTLTRAQFEALRTEHPQVDRFLVQVLAAQVRRLSGHLAEALYVPVETRVLRRLVALAETYERGEGPTIIPLTQDDIATMAGTTRPTANRVLNGACEDGLISMSRGRIEIVDLAGIRSRAR